MKSIEEVLEEYVIIPKKCTYNYFELSSETINEFVKEYDISFKGNKEQLKDLRKLLKLKVYDGIQSTKILNKDQQEEIKRLRDAGYKIKDLCKKFKVSESTIRRVLKNKY